MLWLWVLGSVLAPWLSAERATDADGRLALWVWLAIAGLAVVFISRGPHDDDLDRAIFRRLTLVGPLAFLLALGALGANVLLSLRDRRRAERQGRKPPPPRGGWPGPVLSLPVRRTLALPFEILGEGLFRAFIPREVQLWSRGDAGFDPFFAALTLAMLVVGYALLVAGPRIVAGATLEWRIWAIRFLFYLAAAWAGGGLALPG